MQQTRSTLPGLLLALVAVSAWGLSYIATEWLYTQGLGPFAVLTIRTFLAYAVLLILSHKQFLADELIDEAKFALLGVACIPFYHGLENLALQETNAGTVATIMASAPLFTAFVVIALHHSFRLHWMTKLGIVTVATGMCLIWFDNHVIQQLPAAGFYLALGAALAWACYSALLKSVHKYGAVFMARKTFGWGLIAVMPFYLMEDAAPVEALREPVSAALLVFLAVGPTTLCTLLWQRAAREADQEPPLPHPRHRDDRGPRHPRRVRHLHRRDGRRDDPLRRLVLRPRHEARQRRARGRRRRCAEREIHALLTAFPTASFRRRRSHVLPRRLFIGCLKAREAALQPSRPSYPHLHDRLTKTREGSKIHMGRDPNHLPETLT